MVEQNNPLEKYKDDVGIREEQTNQEVILFFSFDVVNSSLYKTINYYGWAQTLIVLFNELNKRVNNALDEAELWRVLGDEAIFIIRIKDIEELYNYITLIYSILISTIKDLNGGKFFQNVGNFSDQEKELMKLQNILSLKATAWIAPVSQSIECNNKKINNIFQIYNLDSKNCFYEFLGNDIDTGFRISKYTSHGRLVLSFELAYLLAKKTKFLQCLHIITYKHLKGIWNDKYYPIIWFHDPQLYDNLSLEETFEFDEEDTDPLIKEYYDNRDITQKTFLRERLMFTDTFNALHKILKDRNLDSKIEDIEKIIYKTDLKQHDYLKSPTLELHCVAVCYNETDRGILIARRSSNRENFPDLWEFGCAKANKDVSLEEEIIREYSEDFGIDIELIVDETRNDREPIPLAMYRVEKSSGIHKGVIFLAKIKNTPNIQDFQKTRKHSKLQWIYENNIDDFNEAAVTDFKNTLKLAFAKIREIDNNGRN